MSAHQFHPNAHILLLGKQLFWWSCDIAFVHGEIQSELVTSFVRGRNTRFWWNKTSKSVLLENRYRLERFVTDKTALTVTLFRGRRIHLLVLRSVNSKALLILVIMAKNNHLITFVSYATDVGHQKLPNGRLAAMKVFEPATFKLKLLHSVRLLIPGYLIVTNVQKRGIVQHETVD